MSLNGTRWRRKPKDNVSRLTALHRPAVSGVLEVKPTLATLQSYLGLSDVEDPDIGIADAIIDLEDETLREGAAIKSLPIGKQAE